jgi:hypothetical protein
MARVVDATIASSNRLARGARPLPTQVIAPYRGRVLVAPLNAVLPARVSSRNEQRVQI